MMDELELEEIERETDYAEERVYQWNAGEKAVLGMLCLGGAFRFIELLYQQGEIDFTTRRRAGNLLCEKYEDIRREAFIWNFSRGNSENAGCK
jgi:hypothetical protein